jgi:hypothetical protein
MKTYRSNSIVHIGVIRPNGSKVRVSFDALTGGGSLYSTADEGIQYGLEHHIGFGKIFRLDESVVDDQPVSPVAQDEEVKPQVLVVNVSNLDDAKEYLVEKFGLSRTKLRSRAAILDAAGENGIEFVGI